jgi:hypothetical protein
LFLMLGTQGVCPGGLSDAFGVGKADTQSGKRIIKM